MRNDFDDVVSMAFVEGNGRGIVDRGLKTNGMAFCGTQSIFGGFEQSRADMMATGGGTNVDGDDVSHAATAALGDDEGEDRRRIGRMRLLLRNHFSRNPAPDPPQIRDQRKRSRAAQVHLQLIAAVGDFGIKTRLVDRPQGVEIIGAVVADCESHVFYSRSTKSFYSESYERPILVRAQKNLKKLRRRPCPLTTSRRNIRI